MIYIVFSILTGIGSIVYALVPGTKPRDRLWLVLGGALSIGYAIYVSQQTSGTYYFWIGIFIVPFLLAGGLAWKLFERYQATQYPVPRDLTPSELAALVRARAATPTIAGEEITQTSR